MLLREATDLLAYKGVQHINEHRERKRNRKWAKEAWQEIVASGEMEATSEEYVEGFEDGYAEYLYRGGDGEPPTIPPKKFRRLKYQTVEGYRAIQDWFVGYRHGAEVARASGFRKLVTGPSSLRPVEGAVGLEATPTPPVDLPPVTFGPPSDEVKPLSLPRKAKPEQEPMPLPNVVAPLSSSSVKSVSESEETSSQLREGSTPAPHPSLGKMKTKDDPHVVQNSSGITPANDASVFRVPAELPLPNELQIDGPELPELMPVPQDEGTGLRPPMLEPADILGTPHGSTNSTGSSPATNEDQPTDPGVQTRPSLGPPEAGD